MQPLSAHSIQTILPTLVGAQENSDKLREVLQSLSEEELSQLITLAKKTPPDEVAKAVNDFFQRVRPLAVSDGAPFPKVETCYWYRRLRCAISEGTSTFVSSLGRGLSDPSLQAGAIKAAKLAAQTTVWNLQIQKMQKNQDPIEGIFDFIAFLLEEHAESLTDLFPSLEGETLKWLNLHKMDLLVICREVAYLSESARTKDLANHPIIQLLALQFSLRSRAKGFPGERLVRFLDKVSPKTAINRFIWKGVARYVDESRLTYTAANATLKLVGEIPKRVTYFNSKKYAHLFEVCETAKINLTEIDGKTRVALAELHILTESIRCFVAGCKEFVSQTKRYKSFSARGILESGANKLKLCMDLGLVLKNAHALSKKLESEDAEVSTKLKRLLFSSIYYPVAKETTSRYIGPFFISLICMVSSRVFSENIPLQCLNDPLKCPFIIASDNDPRVLTLSTATLVTRFVSSPLTAGNQTFLDSLPEPNLVDSIMNKNISLVITATLAVTALPLVTEALNSVYGYNSLSIETAARLARRQHAQRVMYKPVKDFVRKGKQKLQQFIKQPWAGR